MAGSRFFGHIKWWFFTVPIMAVCVMPVIPSPELFEVPEAEVQSVTATLGQARADEATEHANALFKDTFVETGLVRKTLQATATATSDIGDVGASDFARTWVKHFWMLIYRATYRLTVMKLWLVGTIAFGAAAFVDGTVRRKIKAAAAGFASPLLIFGVTFAVLIVPVAVLAQYWVGVSVVLSMLLWRAASSYQ
jgi:hypothetical protein